MRKKVKDREIHEMNDWELKQYETLAYISESSEDFYSPIVVKPGELGYLSPMKRKIGRSKRSNNCL